MEAAIRLVRDVEPPRPGGRRVMMLGDMLELGPESLALHAGLAPAVEAMSPDLLILCGPDMAALNAALPSAITRHWMRDVDQLLGRLDELLEDGDLVLVKSSGGTKLSAVVQALKEGGRASAG